MATKTTLKPCLRLNKNGIQKLETFFKIAATKEETCFMELDPEQNIIRLNCVDSAHTTNTTHVITNESEDFEFSDLDKILQFNVNVRDFNKMLSLNGDKDISIYPDLDEKNNFDMLQIHIIENNVHLKEILLPISEITHMDSFTTSENVYKNMKESEHIGISIDLDFLLELIKDAEVFQNETIAFNISIKNKEINSLSFETFDIDTDKTRRVKINLFQGLQYQKKTVIPLSAEGSFSFSMRFSLSDLKSILVSSKIYTSAYLYIGNKMPLVIMYNDNDSISPSLEGTLTTMIAPRIYKEEDEEGSKQEQ